MSASTRTSASRPSPAPAAWLAATLSFAGACGEDAPAPELEFEPAAELPELLDPDNPDLSLCGDGPVDAATTRVNELGQIAGWEATNTNTRCPRSPAACGAWWAAIVPVGNEVDATEGEQFTLTFATDSIGDGQCETHVAEVVVGRHEVMERQDVENGVIDPVLICLIDEHGHVASGLAELFSQRGRGTPARSPCD